MSTDVKVPKKVLDYMVREHAHDLVTYENYLRDAENRKKYHEHELEVSDGQIKEYGTELDKIKAKHKDNLVKWESDATQAITQILKHAMVDSVDIEGNYLLVHTKILHADIRTRGGARKTERTCIGAFDIKLKLNEHRLYLVNTIFNEHWAIRDQRPCLGEYEEDFQNAFDRGDYYGVIDMVYHFLLSASEDGAAYTSSHQWRDEYRHVSTLGTNVEPKRNSEGIKVGDYVICTHPAGFESGQVYGMTGIVIDIPSGGLPHVYFKEGMHGHTSCKTDKKVKDWEEGHCWSLPVERLALISKDEWEASSKYEIESVDTMRETLDRMPKGRTMEDFKKARKELEGKGVKLVLKAKKKSA